ncbi:MAG: tautomerase family protein [Desulfuromonadales bacterium]|nr:tautomerase family protein [Desulfuromonadales bacterium]
MSIISIQTESAISAKHKEKLIAQLTEIMKEVAGSNPEIVHVIFDKATEKSSSQVIASKQENKPEKK